MAPGGSVFRARQLTVDDLPACRRVLQWEGVDPAQLPDERVQRWVLARGCGVSAAFERDGPAPARQLVGFGCTAFVGAAFAEEAKRLAAAGRAHEIVERLNAGEGLLGAHEIAAQNGGVGLAALMFGGRADAVLSPPERLEVGRSIWRVLLHAHAGYNIRDVMLLAAGRENKQYMEAANLHRYSDPATPLQLFGLSRADVERRPGGMMDLLFDYRPPRLALSEGQRELLALALNEGLSDEALASRLGVSPAAVKKRWRAIYAAVARAAPGLLPADAGEGKRGPEKRSVLLEYVRAHPSELRAHLHPRGRAATRVARRA